MKKLILVFAMILALSLVLCACVDNSTPNGGETDPTEEITTEEQTTEEQTTEEETTEEQTTEEVTYNYDEADTEEGAWIGPF